MYDYICRNSLGLTNSPTVEVLILLAGPTLGYYRTVKTLKIPQTEWSKWILGAKDLVSGP